MKKLLYAKNSVIKQLTLPEFYELRNYYISKAIARSRTFQDDNKNYWWYQIENIEKQYPEYPANLGLIKYREGPQKK